MMKTFRARLIIVMLLQMVLLALFPLSTWWMEKAGTSILVDGYVRGAYRSWVGNALFLDLEIEDVDWDLVEQPVPTITEEWLQEPIPIYVVLKATAGTEKERIGYVVQRATWQRPVLAAEEVLIVGTTYSYELSRRNPELRVHYDLNPFYVSEDEQIGWKHPGVPAKIELLITPQGYARVQAVMVE